MHEHVNDGPKPPERSAAGGPQLTAPDLSCLGDEDRADLGTRVERVLESLQHGNQMLFNLAMDNFAAMGAHKVGHGLNNLLWTTMQASLVVAGMKPHDMTDAMVVATPVGDPQERTVADDELTDMVSNFMQATFAGAHAAAMEIWANWVDAIGDDWGLYTNGIGNLVGQVIHMTHSQLVENEDASLMMGHKVMSFVPRDHGHDHSED